MGYTHGRKWSEDEVKKEITTIVETLDLKHFPTQSQIINFYGNNSLANKISRSGGSKYYADLLGLEILYCESEFGNFFEEYKVNIRGDRMTLTNLEDGVVTHLTKIN